MDLSGTRILFVHNGSDLYGASRSLLRLSSRLVRDGIKVLVVLPTSGPLQDELRVNMVEVVILPDLAVIERGKIKSLPGLVKLFANLISSTVRLCKLIVKNKPQLVHTNTAIILSSGLAAKLCGIPHIWHVRESFGEYGALWKYYQRIMGWFSNRIVCVSGEIADQFTTDLLQECVRVIHNGIPAEEFAPVDIQRIQTFKKRYAVEKARALVGVVGRIKYLRKGQEFFVEAASKLRNQYPDVRFLCIGSPFPGNESHLKNLQKLIHELRLDDYVICTGDVEDIKAAIAAMDILVLSSAQPEPFGGVVIEGMALSRPIVATRIGGTIEQVIDGVTGYLVEPGNADELGNAIQKLLEDPDNRRDFGKNGRDRFIEHFEFEQFYQKILDQYEQVIFKRA
ncbi:MAG TPA: glycosyltransferase [Anaerolineales bacterium]|jgi:glycosyltransferase involved in cell wall biosynthesis